MTIKYSRGIEKTKQWLQKDYTSDHYRGIWIHGPPNTGKTSSILQAFPDQSIYYKGQDKWFCGYEGEKIIVLDEFVPDKDLLSREIKIWTDKFPVRAEVKGGSTKLQHDWFIITSNWSPGEIYGYEPRIMSALERRIKVIKSEEGKQTVIFPEKGTL